MDFGTRMLRDAVACGNAANTHYCSQIFRTATFKNDAHLQQEILAIWFEITKPFVNVTKGFIPALVFQPLSEPIISHFSRRGGNALGITDSDAPLTRIFPCFGLSVSDY